MPVLAPTPEVYLHGDQLPDHGDQFADLEPYVSSGCEHYSKKEHTQERGR